MIAPELKRSENVQALLTRVEKDRLETLAKEQGWSVSFAARTFLLESVERWEKSAPGRRRRK